MWATNVTQNENVYATLKLKPLAFIACDLCAFHTWRLFAVPFCYTFTLFCANDFNASTLPLFCFCFSVFLSYFHRRIRVFFILHQLLTICNGFYDCSTRWNSLKLFTIAITVCHLVGSLEARMCDAIALYIALNKAVLFYIVWTKTSVWRE